MSEKALVSLDKALRINWGGDVVETSLASFLLPASLSLVKVDQLPYQGDRYELSPQADTTK